MATNYNLLGKDNTLVGSAMDAQKGVRVVTSKIVDLTGKTALDTWTLFNFPKGAQVISMAIEVIEKPSNATCTLDIGKQTVTNGACTTTVGQTFVAGADAYVDAGTLVQCNGTDLITGAGIEQALAPETASFVVGLKLASQGATLTTGKVAVHAVVAQI